MFTGAVLPSCRPTLCMPRLKYRAWQLLLLSRMKSHSLQFDPANLNVQFVSSLNTFNKDYQSCSPDVRGPIHGQ